MRTYEHSFRQLIVWKEAKNLTLFTYKITKKFPQEEKFCLVSQMRRSSSSVMANIAEGNERKSKADCCRFLEIARSSLVETDSHIDLAYELQYLSSKEYEDALERINKTAYLLEKFETSQQKNPKRL